MVFSRIGGLRMAKRLVPDPIRAMVPASISKQARALINKQRSTRNYEALYEAHARAMSPEESIGDGDYDQIGRLEKALLLAEGLQPSDTLLDFGCGTGRLALHVVPALSGGCYIGVDISRTMLRHARAAVAKSPAEHRCSVSFQHQTGERFDIAPHSVDMACAFSVFTHMEHEDNYRYLQGLRRVIKDDGTLVFTCLPMELDFAKSIFIEQAKLDPVARWAGVRNVTTTRQFMEDIADMAGWRTVRWYSGDEANVRDPSNGALCALRQSACVLKPR